MPITLDQLDQILSTWRNSLCEVVDIGGLYARNPVAYKWKAPFRALMLRELAFWRVTDLFEQVSILMHAGRFLGTRILMRSAIETIAVIVYLNQKTTDVMDSRFEFLDYSEMTSRLLLGTRQEVTKHQAINILSVLERADLQYPGIRKAYDDLSESAHPNNDGMCLGYSRGGPENYIAKFEDRWEELFGSSQLPLIELCLRIFELEYNVVWLENTKRLETWLEEHDADLNI